MSRTLVALYDDDDDDDDDVDDGGGCGCYCDTMIFTNQHDVAMRMIRLQVN